MKVLHLLLLFLMVSVSDTFAQPVYEVQEGEVKFYSEASEEIIKAFSGDLKGVIDFSKKTFAFKIAISSFEGFNSALQREHFNENYMETTSFPLATFVGKIIEDVTLEENATLKIRTKGKLKIHGIEDMRIIPVTIKIDNKRVSITGDFTVLLADHQIKIPRVVNNKLSEKIYVSVFAKLAAK